MKRILFALLLLLLGCASHEPVDTNAKEPLTTTARYALRYDFSRLLMPTTRFLGAMDTAKQKLEITFSSLTRASDPLLYNVKGRRKIKGTACTFVGTINIEEIVEYPQMPKGLRAEGELDGAYELREDPAKKNCGIFSGHVKLFWYVDSAGKMTYDDIERAKNGYRNNQYTGTWRAYNSDDKKPAVWGEYLVPELRD